MKPVYSSHPFGGKSPVKKTGNGSRFDGAQMTKWLLIVLAVVFAIDVSGRGGSDGAAGYILPYVALGDSVLYQIWRWISYPLVSLNMGEWLFSMITFFVFGRYAEQALGTRQFATLLGVTTLIGAIIYSIMSASIGSQLPLTGVSGLAIAVLVSVAILYPEQVVQLMIPPVPLKIKNLVVGLIIIMVVMAIAQRADPAITLSQFSAVGVSFLCMKNQHWLNLRKKKVVGKKNRSEAKKKSTKKQVKGMKARTILNMEVSKREAEVNKILDKVSAEGIGNLTEDEREILKFASKK